MPEYREHDTDSLTCWCKPRFYEPCDECGPDLDDDVEAGGIDVKLNKGDRSCWKCGGGEYPGLIEVSYEHALLEERDPIVIVHNDA